MYSILITPSRRNNLPPVFWDYNIIYNICSVKIFDTALNGYTFFQFKFRYGGINMLDWAINIWINMFPSRTFSQKVVDITISIRSIPRNRFTFIIRKPIKPFPMQAFLFPQNSFFVWIIIIEKVIYLFACFKAAEVFFCIIWFVVVKLFCNTCG